MESATPAKRIFLAAQPGPLGSLSMIAVDFSSPLALWHLPVTPFTAMMHE